ncbi:SipW-dependent-type signal peptide-containing protein, partial [Symbiobacterium thermophilum]
MGLRFVWLSLLFVILTGGLLGATTLALFTDQAESSGQFTSCTLPLRCSTVVNTEGALFGGSAPARITKAGPTEHVLQPGEQHDITITVELPKEAGNAYQNAQGTLTITFFAPQRTNMEWVP